MIPLSIARHILSLGRRVRSLTLGKLLPHAFVGRLEDLRANRYTLLWDKQLAEVEALHGLDMWVGYDKGGWAVPAKWDWRYCITLFKAGGVVLGYHWYAEHPDYPDLMFCFPYQTMELRDDGKGNYYSDHPVSGIVLDRSRVEALFSSAIPAGTK